MKTYWLPFIALIFLSFAGYHLARSQSPRQLTDPPQLPARSPFGNQVAGLGIVEACAENVAIGVPNPGIVEHVQVKEGDRVKAGELLFLLDTRQAQADVRVKEAMLESARLQLQRLKAMPRPEELPAMSAQVSEMQAIVKQKEDALARSKKLHHSGAVSEQSYIVDLQALEAARAQLLRTQAQEKLLKAGAWDADKQVSQASIVHAEAQLQQTKTELDRLRILAPSSTKRATEDPATADWEVLKVNVRAGEFVGTNVAQQLIVLGDTGPRHVRVDIDENDIPRFKPSAKAIAYVRGDNHQAFELQFVRVQPFVVPKKSLSGDSLERVDTRVLQVLYSLGPASDRVYIGQQMDVFLQMHEEQPEAALTTN